MANNRAKYFRRTRKRRMRGLQYSPTGWLSLSAGLCAAAFAVVAVAGSYRLDGEGGFGVGGFGMTAFFLAVAAWMLGILCRKEQDIRPLPPKAGTILGVVITCVLGVTLIGGCI